jgi:hypothetical protein
MKYKIPLVLSLLALAPFTVQATDSKDDLCTIQRYSVIYGGVVETYRDSNCYVAQNYCDEDVRAAPADPDAGGYSQECKKPEERITSASVSYTLYHRGIVQTTIGATRYDTSYPEYNAERAAYNKCSRERESRAKSSPDYFSYISNSSCTRN